MPNQNYEYRFLLKPGRYVYIQSATAASFGKVAVRQILRKYNPNEIFFHIGKRGGHVAAIKLHQGSHFFSRFDITNFFGQITRTKVSRSLREVGFNRHRAFDIAFSSVVVEDGRKVIPYGFSQSPLLSTLALEKSRLGAELILLRSEGFLVSVYVDDIIVSGADKTALERATERLETAAGLAGFPLAANKTARAETSVDAFNCEIGFEAVELHDDRLRKFVSEYMIANDAAQEAIERYIHSLSTDELVRFRSMLPPVS